MRRSLNRRQTKSTWPMSLAAIVLAGLTWQQPVKGSSAFAGKNQAATQQQPGPELRLYQGFFSIVAHMERDRLTNPPNNRGDVAVIEDALRTEIGLSGDEWKMLLSTAVRVDAYVEQTSGEAQTFAHRRRSEVRQGTDMAPTMSLLKATLHQMQLEEDDKLGKDIQQLEESLGEEPTVKLHAYLNGPLAKSAHKTALQPSARGTW